MNSSPVAVDTEFKRNFNGKPTRELSAGVVGGTVSPAPATSFGQNVRGKSFFENAISTEWRKNVASIIQTGKLIGQAKDELAPHDFAALKVPFEPRVSQMLRRIATNLILS